MSDLSDSASLFHQLQSRYPASSLVTELVQVHQGSFIVRALVQVGGQILATGMAAAVTIEVAEDQARGRVLKLLGIPLTPSPSSFAAPGYPALPLPSLVAPLEPNRLLTPPPLPEREDNLELLANPNSQSTPDLDLSVSPPEADAPAPASSKSPKRRTVAKVAPPPPTLTEPEPLALQPEALELAGGPELPAPVASPAGATLDDFDRAALDLDPPEPELAEPEAELDVEPIDLSELIALTDVEMQRVGWSRKRGQTHLKQTYGRDKRADLDEDQLLEFLHFLRALPSQYETPFKA